MWATEPVKIVNPDPAWSEQGLKIIHQLRELLLPFKVTEIEHIGSTAIPNLSAKPIIDIMAKL
ncbi:GrpB family protein [Paenibacillus polymyxa]|uniref:GrpB family protein n=1 Tax=Paenibacillus polymyxa TaxID=1406 RepID=UPI0037C55573